MLKLQKNRGGYTQCEQCFKEIEYYEDYYVNSENGENYCEKCAERSGE